jgi:hypothetical protein
LQRWNTTRNDPILKRSSSEINPNSRAAWFGEERENKEQKIKIVTPWFKIPEGTVRLGPHFSTRISQVFTQIWNLWTSRTNPTRGKTRMSKNKMLKRWDWAEAATSYL